MNLNFLNSSPKTVPQFQPERGENESQEAYRSRRRQAQKAVKRMTCAGMNGGESLRSQMRKGKHKGRVRAADVLMQHWASKRRDEGAYRKAMAEWASRRPTYIHPSASV